MEKKSITFFQISTGFSIVPPDILSFCSTWNIKENNSQPWGATQASLLIVAILFVSGQAFLHGQIC